MGQIESTMGLAVFIDEDLNTAEQAVLEQRIRAIPNVADVLFISREDGLQELRETLGEDLIRGLERDNPIRDSFMVELIDLSQHDAVERAILNLEPYGAAGIRSHSDLANTLSTITSIIQMVSAILVIILAGISIIIITNTIRITVNARKTEINIMKYVGATDWFIRWPFVLEGMIIGLLGGAVPAFICYFGYSRVVDAIREIPQLAFIEFLPDEHIMSYVFPFALILGVFIGLLGSITSVKKHLKV
jgi:cell division transport system permease protein